VGRITAAGAVTEHVITAASGAAFPYVPDLAVGADGSAWVVAGRFDASSMERSTLVRIADDGRVLARLPELATDGEEGSYYGAVGRGPDGSVFYVRYYHTLGMQGVTGSAGRLSGNRSVQNFNVYPSGDLALGPDDALWFPVRLPRDPDQPPPPPDEPRPTLGRLSRAGTFTAYDVGPLNSDTMVGGPGGKLWVCDGTGILSLTTSGSRSDAFRPPFPAPSQLEASVGDATATVHWGAIPGADSYRVTVTTGPSPELAERQLSADGTSIEIDQLAMDRSSGVSVRGVGSAGFGLAARELITPLGRRAYVPAADFSGDRRTEVAVFRPGTGTWYVRGRPSVRWGTAGDVPVPADYTGDGIAELAVWRPDTGTWYVRGRPAVRWGTAGDVPVPADYTGDGIADPTVWRPSTGTWHVRGRAAVPWGLAGDIPMAANHVGDRRADLTVWRPSTGRWHTRGVAAFEYGYPDDRPVVIDRDGDGRHEPSIVRPSSGEWWVRGEGRVRQSVSYPVPGNFDGIGGQEAVTFEPWRGQWSIGSDGATWGLNGDLPV
jgi:hypothetical protein